MAAAEGYSVCVNYRTNRSAAEDVVQQIAAIGGRAIAIAANVTDEEAVAAMFDRAADELGPIAALVNNAGILETQSSFSRISVDRFRRILETNVVGAFICAREAVRRMSRSSGGDGGGIVNVSSVAASTGAPHEYIDYAASKGALDSMTAGLAREVAAEGIRVNLVRPGFIRTEMHAAGGEPDRVDRLLSDVPLQRGGEPDDVARAILWLLSDRAAYAVGVSLGVTGGV
jgi:NAD(P)-dependent dehydrogenase (short-subunit alcohol dehydrogenase family)